MSRILLTVAALGVMTVAVHAQDPAAPSPQPDPATAEPQGDASSAQAKPADATATDQTYKMKDGGMYQPPAQRPASPAMDTKVYGRT